MEQCYNKIVDILVSAKARAEEYDRNTPLKFRSAVKHINHMIYKIDELLNSNIPDQCAQNVIRLSQLQNNDPNIVKSLKSQSHRLENIDEESQKILRAVHNFVASDDEKTNRFILDTDICPKGDIDKLRLVKTYLPIYNYLQSIIRNQDACYRENNFTILNSFLKDFGVAFSPKMDFDSFVQNMEKYTSESGVEKVYSLLEIIFCDTNVLEPCGLIDLVKNMETVDWPVETDELC
jgi:hypothetical protein